jgi:hypothetical protein
LAERPGNSCPDQRPSTATKCDSILRATIRKCNNFCALWVLFGKAQKPSRTCSTFLDEYLMLVNQSSGRGAAALAPEPAGQPGNGDSRRPELISERQEL